MKRFYKTADQRDGFTIVELLIVVVVIAILAAITVVAYNGIANQAKVSALKSELNTGAKQLKLNQVEGGAFPVDKPDYLADNLAYSGGGDGFCLTISDDINSFYVTEEGAVGEGGECPIDPSLHMQNVTNANCPTARTMKVDARDRHTYWVQKLADGKCWMLTSLAYGGGGNNTYNDVIPAGDGSMGTLSGPDNLGEKTYTLAKYYIHTDSNPSTYPQVPSISNDGGITNAQYGYYYNWCAAMGAQNGGLKTSTAACTSTTSPRSPVTSISICPAGWRLPAIASNGGSGEFYDLIAALPAPANATGIANLQNIWLANRSGWWNGSPNFFDVQGRYGYFWSSGPRGTSDPNYAYTLYFGGTGGLNSASPAVYYQKQMGLPVRCIS